MCQSIKILTSSEPFTCKNGTKWKFHKGVGPRSLFGIHFQWLLKNRKRPSHEVFILYILAGLGLARGYCISETDFNRIRCWLIWIQQEMRFRWGRAWELGGGESNQSLKWQSKCLIRGWAERAQIHSLKFYPVIFPTSKGFSEIKCTMLWILLNSVHLFEIGKGDRN